MLQKNKNHKQEGFTIIEVLIVLAIAGLILLIVFLAVPALQRNSRNTQAKNSAAVLLGGISEFSNNNDGKLPTGITTTSGGTPSTTDIPNATEVYFGTATTNTTSSTRVNGPTVSFKTAAYSSLPLDGTLVVVIGFKCDTTRTTASVAAARASSVVYALETSGTSVAKCVDS